MLAAVCAQCTGCVGGGILGLKCLRLNLFILCDTTEWRSGSDTAGSIPLGDGSGTARQYEILPVDVTTACDEDVGSAGGILSV